MNTTEPATWSILEFTSRSGIKTYKVFGGWYGTIAYGDKWKLSTGIETFIDRDFYFESLQVSGGYYLLTKERERLSAYQMGLLQGWATELAEEGVKVRTVSSQDFIKQRNRLDSFHYDKNYK